MCVVSPTFFLLQFDRLITHCSVSAHQKMVLPICRMKIFVDFFQKYKCLPKAKKRRGSLLKISSKAGSSYG